MTAPVRVLVVDDHAIVRGGLRQVLDTVDDIELVGEAADGETGVRLADELRPDVVLMDLSMPGIDGVEATERIAAAGTGLVLVLTSMADQGHILRALDAGAAGYLLKHADPEAILEAIRSVVTGGAPLDPKAARVLLARHRGTLPSPPGTAAPHGAAATVVGTEQGPAAAAALAERLTAREREVLGLVASGLANKQIARRLGISERTVKAHLTSVFARLGVTDRTQAALWAQRHLDTR